MLSLARCLTLALASLTAATSTAGAAPLTHYLYTSAGELEGQTALLARPEISGVQVIYNWRRLEPSEGQYDFSAIEADLALARAAGKQLFIQIQDRFFSTEARNLPDYILTDPVYEGGLVPQYQDLEAKKLVQEGWAARQWNPALRARFQALLAALGQRFDGQIAGLNLPETAVEVNAKDPATGFSCDAYFSATLDTMGAARKAFATSAVVQYVNFWPCEWNNDRKYMERVFAFAAENRIGLGGPDIVPWRKGQMKNAYPFFHSYRGKLPLVAMAIQEPTLAYINPETKKRFTRAEFESFASDYLGVNIIFWSAETPWLAAKPAQ